MVSAILFAPGEGSLLFQMIDSTAYQHPDQPRVVSVDCRPHGLYSTPLVEDNFPDQYCRSKLLTRGVNGDILIHPLQIWYSPSAFQSGSPVNRAIYNMTSGRAARLWCGAAVVLKFTNTQCRSYTGAGLNDVPALSAFFQTFA